MFAALGGVPKLVVPDNLLSGVRKSCRYDPDVNPTYQEMAAHYGVGVLPARSNKPRDKAKAESGVLIVERWILARLRNHTFFSLSELNREICRLCSELNDRPFQKLPGTRRSLFETVERAVLRPLPAEPYVFAEWKKAVVNIDYHVAVDHHFYSVPHRLLRERVEVRLSTSTVEIFHDGKRVAMHRRSRHRGKATTDPLHRPKAHREHLAYPPSRLIRWAEKTGPETAAVVTRILEERLHPEQGYRPCLGILRLGDRYSPERLEAACRRARRIQGVSYRSIKSILEHGPDQLPLEEQATLDLPQGARQHPWPLLLLPPQLNGDAMLLEPTLARLRTLRLDAMANALQEQQGLPDIDELSFEDRLGLLVEREAVAREDRRLARLLHQARLRLPASIEALDLRASRGLDRSVLLRLGTGDWIRQHQVVLITGATGTGKTFLACALAQAACRHGLSARYYRVGRLLEELALARGDGSWPRLLDRLQKTRLLVLDDFGLVPLSEVERRDLLEVIEDRSGRQATLVSSPSSTGTRPSATPPSPMPSWTVWSTTHTASP